MAARLCEGAFDALMGGDVARHDAMVADALGTLGREVDVIVLAQASMARVVEGLAAEDAFYRQIIEACEAVVSADESLDPKHIRDACDAAVADAFDEAGRPAVRAGVR